MALVGVLVGLFVVAYIKPRIVKQTSIDDFKRELDKHLPTHDIIVKHGTPSRLIISQDGTQRAIIVLDKPRDDYQMGGLPIFTTDKVGRLRAIADKIKANRTLN